jgi:hypothetical protein
MRRRCGYNPLSPSTRHTIRGAAALGDMLARREASRDKLHEKHLDLRWDPICHTSLKKVTAAPYDRLR